MLNRLRELAQRQSDLNDRLKEVQSALEAAKDPQARAELERQLKRLRDQEQQILRDTDLGIATLIAEDEEGHYEPVSHASSLAEGFEMAKEDLHNRQRKLEADQDPGLCPWEYKVWARGLEGKMVVAAAWSVSDL